MPRPEDRPGIANVADESDMDAYEFIAPIAAAVSIAGRVTTSTGRAIGSTFITRIGNGRSFAAGGDEYIPILPRGRIGGRRGNGK